MVAFAAVSAPASAGAAIVETHASAAAGDWDELVFTAMPGEANRVTAQRIDGPEPPAAVWTVRDEGAPVVAGPGCKSLDTQTARCEAPAGRFELGAASDQLRVMDAAEAGVSYVVERGAGDDVLIADGARCRSEPVQMCALTGATFRGGDGNDHLVGATRMDGGNGDDLLQGGPGNDDLDGGRGADRLEGASGYDTLAGGGGRDTMLGGADSDSLSDGDRTGATDDTAPDTDLLDGGAGKTTALITASAARP
jgi:Ca2+-binding RTX toxin-like protein